MPDLQRIRQTAEIAVELDAQRVRCERVGDTFAGLAMLFSATAALILFGGWWTGEPLVMVSFAFALAPAVAFAFLARTMTLVGQATPRIVTAPATVATPQPPVRFVAEPKWRQAA